jgi:hypothetical protein
MIAIYYSICLAILILGLVRGKPRAVALSFPAVSVAVLFWVSVVGVAAVLASVAGVVGIAVTFDERTDSVNGFDTLCAASRQIVGLCFTVALVAHGITAIWRTGPKKESEQANAAYRR